MALQPPSFFQAPSKTSQKQPRDAKTLPTSPEPLAPRGHPCPHHCLPTSSNIPAHGLQVAAGQQAAVLTTDLLAVEAHLQSRMRLLEEEKRNLIGRIVELEKNVVQQKEERESKIESLTSQHNHALLQAQVEVKQLTAECRRLREEGESRTAQLESELRTREEHHSKEVESLSAKLRELEEHSQLLTVELEEKREACGKEVCQLRGQLTTETSERERQREESEGQLRSLSDEAARSHQRVRELEGYLGGEIPHLPKEKDGNSLTWREEREKLHSIVETLERDLHKMQSEDKLLNIRLTSLMEILSIQETTIAKQSQASLSDGRGVEGRDADSASALRILLTRWREKVFVLLVQNKLSQIHDSRLRHEATRKEAGLTERIQIVERDKDLLSHSLVDRNAELQLQISKTDLAERRLAESLNIAQDLERRLQGQDALLRRVLKLTQSASQSQGSCLASFNQAMTRMANLEHRINMMLGRINSVKATLSYQMAVHQRSKVVACADCGVQTQVEVREDGGSQCLTSLSRVELIGELRSLSRERRNLVRQLEESTATFQQQMDSLNNTCSTKLAATEAQLSSVQRDNCSLSEELSQLKQSSEALTEKDEELKLRVEELEGELREAKSTVETRVDMAVRKQQHASSEGMAEMEKLLSVARREHGKAVVQLQQLQRQLSRDKERAMEAMALNQARLEQQLESCRKKLEASQVERNLLTTVLRQEGIAVPLKQRSSPKRRRRESGDEGEDERSSGRCEEGGERQSSLCEDSRQSPPGQTRPHNDQGQDIKEVLKDLQLLSCSLLEMEKPQSLLTVKDPQLKGST